MNSEIKIPLSKIKILLLTLGSVGFVVACFFMLSLEDNEVRGSALFGKIIAIFGIIFFGAAGIVGLRKLFDFRTGLVINEKGIIDNSSAVSIGLILWEDIVSYRIIEVKSTKIFLLKVENPNQYIEKGKTGFQKKLLRANHQMYGTPISISTNSLKIKSEDLQKLLDKHLDEELEEFC